MVNGINISGDTLGEAALEFGKVGRWMEAIGLIIILWIGFQIVSLIINILKKRNLSAIKEDLSRIEKKVDKLSKKKK